MTKHRWLESHFKLNNKCSWLYWYNKDNIDKSKNCEYAFVFPIVIDSYQSKIISLLGSYMISALNDFV